MVFKKRNVQCFGFKEREREREREERERERERRLCNGHEILFFHTAQPLWWNIDIVKQKLI